MPGKCCAIGFSSPTGGCWEAPAAAEATGKHAACVRGIVAFTCECEEGRIL